MICLKNGNWVIAEDWDIYRNKLEALECGYEIDPETGEWIKYQETEDDQTGDGSWLGPALTNQTTANSS